MDGVSQESQLRHCCHAPRFFSFLSAGNTRFMAIRFRVCRFETRRAQGWANTTRGNPLRGPHANYFRILQISTPLLNLLHILDLFEVCTSPSMRFITITVLELRLAYSYHQNSSSSVSINILRVLQDVFKFDMLFS